jgi:hypothetical protein
MIFRRIKAHVEKENWFAVGIDFCIVVIGVFIGIQVANWNEARAVSVQETSYLRQLKDEISFISNTAIAQEEFVETVVHGGKRGLAFLEKNEPCVVDCETTLIAFFHASQIWGTSFPDSKYQELTRLGLPTDEATRAAAQKVYNFLDGWDTINTVPPVYRERVRGHFSPDISSVLWAGCYSVADVVEEVVSEDCASDLNSVELGASLERIWQDEQLATSLRFWVGQNEYALKYRPEIQALTDAAIQTIDDELERRQ